MRSALLGLLAALAAVVLATSAARWPGDAHDGIDGSRTATPGDAAPKVHVKGVAAGRCRGVQIGVRTDLQAAVNAHPERTVFCIRAGIHRLRRYVVPKDFDRFLGERGAVLSGAKVLRSFRREGRFWFAPNQRQQNPVVAGHCVGRRSTCRYADDVFLDGRPLRRAERVKDLDRGSFYFDYARDRIYIARNPRGHKIEAAVVTRAFKGWKTGVDGVTIRGLVIEKFASEAGRAAINGRRTWTVEGNEIRLNHGIGIQDAGVIRDNYIHHNGQLGVASSYEHDLLLEGNVISSNNYAGFDPGWEAGGAKWARVDGLVVRRNRVLRNGGPGLWTDGGSIRVTIENNVVARNTGPGIFHETGYDAVIRGNVVRRNGYEPEGWLDGAGILLNSSRSVEVARNVVDRNGDGIGITQTDRGEGPHGPHETRDVNVHDNVVTMLEGQTGLVHDISQGARLYSDNGNRFDRNTYFLGCRSRYFAWRDPDGGDDYAYLSKDDWLAAGNDRRGRFRSICK